MLKFIMMNVKYILEEMTVECLGVEDEVGKE